MPEDTIFSKIVSGEMPADIVFKDDRVTAFRDISPQAPTHILIVPNKAIPTVNDVTPEDEATLGHLFVVAAKLAEEERLRILEEDRLRREAEARQLKEEEDRRRQEEEMHRLAQEALEREREEEEAARAAEESKRRFRELRGFAEAGKEDTPSGGEENAGGNAMGNVVAWRARSESDCASLLD